MPRIKFEVTGQVQGVFFRDHTVKKASSLGVTGWVRNTQSESVEGEAQHKEEPKLDSFVNLNHEGSPDAEIEQAKVEKISEVEGEKGFSQR